MRTAILFSALSLHAVGPAAAAASSPQSPSPQAVQQEVGDAARLLRFPHVQGDHVAFVKGGDIWIAHLDDLRARRLTSFDDGYELFPRISPDGRLVAFSGEYDGSRQIYVVPTDGGKPRQLTHYPDIGPMPPRGGYDHLPLDWTPDGEEILFRANRTPYGKRVGRYFLVRADGKGMERPLQIPEGGAATFSPDGTKLAYNIMSREWRTWKRYTAGRAQDVYVYDLEANSIDRLTTYEGTDNHPMWLGDRVYFTSDRTGTLELWRHDLASGEQRQVTDFGTYDVLWPSRGDRGIVFENGGDLWLMDAATEAVRKLAIRLADDEPWTRSRWHDGAKSFGSFTIADDPEQAVVEFRGELFAVDSTGPDHAVRDVTRTPQRRERYPALSPDGNSLAFVAEAGLDLELFVRTGPDAAERQLTKDTDAWIRSLDWSPDGAWLACTDNRNRLWVVDVASGERRVLDEDREERLRGVEWALDSFTLCYSKVGPNGHTDTWIATVDGAPAQRATSTDWDDTSPSFDPNGEILWFVSARDFDFGDLDFEERIFGVMLQAGDPSPLRSVVDEDDETDEDDADDEEEEDAPAVERVRIDFDGIADRTFVLPLESGSYGGLIGVDGGVVFRGGSEGWQRFDLATREASELDDLGDGAVVVSAGRKAIAFRKDGDLQVTEFDAGNVQGAKSLDLADLRVRIHPPTEWAQMFTDAWRIMRDFFYDPTMHRTDWRALRTKYLPLTAHLSSREDLDYLLGELIGEINAGHTYVNDSAEAPEVDREIAGTLGCEFEVDRGRYRIAKIFAGENWNDATRSPLTEPGLDVAVGDYVLAIDGHDLTSEDDPFRLLLGKAGRRVEITVADDPAGADARTLTLEPRDGDQPLRYLDWVQRNRALVDAMSGGRIGYVHVPNTAVEGHRELYEGWLAQARSKDAMLIDDRYNGGGFLPDRMAHRVGDEVLNFWARRHLDLSQTPDYAFDGPRAMLINGYSSSGGDAFPYYFRALGTGKLIGSRTWGGLIGYTGSPRLVDGGGLAVPSFSFVNKDGEWDVEAFGVAPDIEVFDDPTKIQAGGEPVLEAGVKHLLGELRKRGDVPKRPAVPPYPDRRAPVDPASAPGRGN